jgi:pectate lyase
MKRIRLLLAVSALTLAGNALADASTDIAPNDGWAFSGTGGTTTGGSAAAANFIYKVSSASQLKAALSAAGSNAKIVKVYGTIDMTSADNGGAFTSKADQVARNLISIPSNTTLIGMGSDAMITNATISIKKVSNVIVRNLTITAPCDLVPVWDASESRWNSQFDAVLIYSGTRIWIDHNKFTDAPLTDDKLPVENGQVKQCHDGALDINHVSDFITVSNNVFDQHDKNNLIGSSDSSTDEDGHLKVTFHHNLFTKVMERAPRVRYGQVHIYNNYYSGSKSDAPYKHNYSVGVGYKAKILSMNNVFEVTGAKTCADVVKNPGSSTKTGAITDTGSLLNGANLALSTACSSFATTSWTIPYSGYTLDAAADVKAKVTSNAGVGKLVVN